MEQRKPMDLELDFDVLRCAIEDIKPQRHGLLCPLSTFEKEKVCNCGYEDEAAFYEKAREAIGRIKSENARLKGQAEAVSKVVEASRHALTAWNDPKIEMQSAMEKLCAAFINLDTTQGDPHA